jgi:hypothetical protein
MIADIPNSIADEGIVLRIGLRAMEFLKSLEF